MLSLVVILIILLIVLSSETQKAQRARLEAERQLEVQRQSGLDFIAGYMSHAKSKVEQSLLKRMLDDYRSSHGFPADARPSPSAIGKVSLSSQSQAQFQTQTSQNPVQPAVAAKPSVLSEPIDNASLLLYLGAFLFVASAGLFVGFGSAPGTLKVIIVALVTAIMYGGGVWLNAHKPKLKRAGQAFAGIGIVLAPLIGVSLYTYVFDQQQGMLVWLLTSLLCLGLYAHALKVFRSTLMGYVLVFTFLSLFESGVGVLDAPVYYYGWGLALVGLLLQLGNRFWGWWPEVRTSSQAGAQLFLPVALFASALMTTEHGATQLGVSLLLAAVFYGLETLRGPSIGQQAYAAASQISATLAVGAVAYGVSESWPVAAWTVMAMLVIQVGAMFRRGRPNSALWRNFGSVLLVLAAGNAIASISYPGVLLASLAAAVLVGRAVWSHQQRAEAHGLAGLAFVAMPYVYGQMFEVGISWKAQTCLSLLALAVVVAVQLLEFDRHKGARYWKDASVFAYLIGVIGVVLASIIDGGYMPLLAALAVVASLVILAETTRDKDWPEAIPFMLIVPLVQSFDDNRISLVTVVTILATLVVLVIRYRTESLRAAATVVALLLPLAVGRDGLGHEWSAAGYAWGYIFIVGMLLAARVVSRIEAPKSAEVGASYAVGYVSAAFIAVGCSLFAANSQLHTSIILALLAGVVWLVGTYIERRREVLCLLPLVAQALLWSGVRPPDESGSVLNSYLVASMALATASYTRFRIMHEKSSDAAWRVCVQTSILTAFTAPLAVLYAPLAWPMAAGLVIAGMMLLQYYQHRGQDKRDAAVAVIAAGVAMFLYWAGIREFQAYVHVAIATLGVLAYWRDTRGEIEQANQYLWALLITATVPLAFQALGSDQAGGLYGWWLLLEQVAIMLLGMAIKRHFVTMWGLYVAVAAVLYQLRGLGYAALAVLAVFLIGLALYSLQKSGKR